MQLLYSFYHQSIQSDDHIKLQLKSSNELDKSIREIEKNFYDLLSISIVFKKINEEKREIAKNEKIKKSKSRFNLSDNKVVNFIETNREVIDGLIKYENKWGKETEEIRIWYKILLEEDFYKEYIRIDNPTFDDDYNFFAELILKFLIKNEVIVKFFEENNIFWSEDFLIVRSMLKKTVKSMNSSNFNTFAVASLSEDIKEDLKFASSLFDIVVQDTGEYDVYIKKYAKNWDLERITLMDRSILRMGIGEMLTFSNIPVKVTINECIDIAKNYSSPKSGKFINGLLDVISLITFLTPGTFQESFTAWSVILVFLLAPVSKTRPSYTSTPMVAVNSIPDLINLSSTSASIFKSLARPLIPRSCAAATPTVAPAPTKVVQPERKGDKKTRQIIANFGRLDLQGIF